MLRSGPLVWPFWVEQGSAYYEIRYNYCVYGGHKSLVGHSKVSHHNIHVHPSVYGTSCFSGWGYGPAGYEEGYHDNVCILPTAGATYLAWSGNGNQQRNLTSASSSPLVGLTFYNNTVFAPGEPMIGVQVGIPATGTMNASTFWAAGYDPGSTTSSDMPTALTVNAWARALLLLAD